MVPEDLPCGIQYLFTWTRSDTHIGITAILQVVITELSFGCASWHADDVPFSFLICQSKKTLFLQLLRQHGSVVSNLFSLLLL